MATAAKPVGRPRDPNVTARNEAILRILADGPRSRSSIAEALGCDSGEARWSLQQLKREGHARLCTDNGRIVWAINDGTACP